MNKMTRTHLFQMSIISFKGAPLGDCVLIATTLALLTPLLDLLLGELS